MVSGPLFLVKSIQLCHQKLSNPGHRLSNGAKQQPPRGKKARRALESCGAPARRAVTWWRGRVYDGLIDVNRVDPAKTIGDPAELDVGQFLI